MTKHVDDLKITTAALGCLSNQMNSQIIPTNVRRPMTANIHSKTLIANWVEERQCAHLEEGNRNPDGTLHTKLHRAGHKGITSPNPSSSMDCDTTMHLSYTSPSPASVRTVGQRKQLLKQHLFEVISNEVHEEFNPPPPPMDYNSTTKKDYGNDFTPSQAPPTMSHDLYSEAPLSYWATNSDKVTGITQQTSKAQSPFSKNTSFSTPIEHYLDQPKPHARK